ncbi:MAG: prefoldin subunit [archaeon]|jgi:chaperonin cofactor prefoldin|nr:prefoldin subunit [archaeon]
MSELERLQVVVGEVQSARQQVAAVRNQVSELEGTIAAVQAQPEGLALHRHLGGVLIEVADRAALLEDLRTSHAQLQQHLERLSEHEARLVEAYEELRKDIEGSA